MVENTENTGAVLLPALHLLQENDNQIAADDVDCLARMLKLDPQEIWSVMSFYDCFNYQKDSRYILKVCTGICCSLNNSDRLIEHLKKRLNIETGETTANGQFTLETVDCLGYCGEGPVLQVNNEKTHPEMTPEKANELLDELRKRTDGQQ